MQDALAGLTELSADMQGQLGVSDGTLERIQERIEEKRDLAAGRVRVARDSLNDDGRVAEQAQQAAHAHGALERFEATRGRGASPEAEAP